MTVSNKEVSYRKIDVDSLDPEKYQPVEPIYDLAYGNSSGPNENAVKQLLQVSIFSIGFYIILSLI